MMSYQASNSYGYQRPAQMAYSQPQTGIPMMGSAGVYGGAPVVSFPSPPVAPAVRQAKPYYRSWDNTQKKWFFWEKDSTETTWIEPAAHITIIDHQTGSVVQRDPAPTIARPAPAVVGPASTGSYATQSRQFPMSNVQPTSHAASVSKPVSLGQSVQQPAVTQRPVVQQSVSNGAASTPSVVPNYSAGVSRYTPANAMGSSQSGISAAEKARLEEADRLIAEQLQKQLSMEAEAELVASCPLPGEAAKLISAQKKKPSKPSSNGTKADEDKLIADMAQNGFVIKKQKQKKTKPATNL